MTVKELINKLNTIKDKSITVTINPYISLHEGEIPQAIRPYPITGVGETYGSGLLSEQGYKKGSFNIDIKMRLFDKFQLSWDATFPPVPLPPLPKIKKNTKTKSKK